MTFPDNRGRLEIQKSEPPRGGRSDVLQKIGIFGHTNSAVTLMATDIPMKEKLFWSIASFFMLAAGTPLTRG